MVWKVAVHPKDKEKISLSASNGLNQFKDMLLGLCNAPATFERLMELFLGIHNMEKLPYAPWRFNSNGKRLSKDGQN